MSSKPLFLDIGAYGARVLGVYAFILVVHALLFWLSTGQYDCQQKYMQWQCFSNCKSISGNASSTSTCLHPGEFGVDLKHIAFIVAIFCGSASIVAVILTLVKLVLLFSPKQAYLMKVIGCVAVCDFIRAVSYILSSSFVLKNHGTAMKTCNSVQAFLETANVFSFLASVLWHSRIACSTFFLASNSEFYHRLTTKPKFFALISFVIWTTALGLSYGVRGILLDHPDFSDDSYITPCSVPPNSPFFWGITWGVYLCLGFIPSMCVFVYTVRKLGLRLLGVGAAKRTRSILFLLKVVGVFYLV
jgi:hypothetical protein